MHPRQPADPSRRPPLTSVLDGSHRLVQRPQPMAMTMGMAANETTLMQETTLEQQNNACATMQPLCAPALVALSLVNRCTKPR